MRAQPLLLAACLTLTGALPAARAGDAVCSDFDDGTFQGWTAQAATIALDTPGPDGSTYLRGHDAPSPPSSVIIAPDTYHGDWTARETLSTDIIVYDDGWEGEVRPVPTVFVIQSSPVPGEGIRALFRPIPEITELDGWRHFDAPIGAITSLPLPGNEYGHWEFIPPQDDPFLAWNTLMTDVRSVHFVADVASSPSGTEDLGVDNVCLSPDGDPTPVAVSTWTGLKALHR